MQSVVSILRLDFHAVRTLSLEYAVMLCLALPLNVTTRLPTKKLSRNQRNID